MRAVCDRMKAGGFRRAYLAAEVLDIANIIEVGSVVMNIIVIYFAGLVGIRIEKRLRGNLVLGR